MVSQSTFRPLNGLVRGALVLVGLAIAVNCGGGSSSPAAAPAPTVPAPGITTHPQSQTASEGHYVSLSVVATGTDLAYTWRKNGTAIAGLSSAAFYSFQAAMVDDGAHYSVVVKNAGGTVISQDAVLTVRNAAGDLIQNGSFETLAANGNATSWTFSDANMTIPYAQFSIQPPTSGGTHFLANGMWAGIKNDSAHQTVTIPANATQATLAFKLGIGNMFTFTPGVTVNTYTVKIKDNAGADLETLVAKTDNDENVSYGQPVFTSMSFDLIAYKGRTIRIAFESIQSDAAKDTLFCTDLVTLNVQF